MTELRPYQTLAVEMLRATLARSKRVVLRLDTGAGKTLVFSAFTKLAAERGRRTLMLVDRIELLEQASRKLREASVEHGLIHSASERTDHAVQVASKDTLIRREPMRDVDLLVIDECHIAAQKTIETLIARHNPKWIVGLSATPARADGKPLPFDAIVEPVSFAELAHDGYLCDPVVYGPDVPDLDGVHTVAGDYNAGELLPIVSKLTGNIVTTFQRLGMLPAVGFAVDRQHARELAESCCAAGIDAISIDGSASDTERAAALRHPGLVWSVDLYLKGIDRPEWCCAVVARPTKSMTVHRQMLGRITRPKPRAVVLDHAGNALRLGLPSEPIAWSLTGKPQRAKATPIRVCSKCYRVNVGGSKACGECGFVFPIQPRKRPKLEPGELKIATPERKAAVYKALVAKGARLGYKPGWPAAVFKGMFGHWPESQRAGRADHAALWQP